MLAFFHGLTQVRQFHFPGGTGKKKMEEQNCYNIHERRAKKYAGKENDRSQQCRKILKEKVINKLHDADKEKKQYGVKPGYEEFFQFHTEINFFHYPP
jgi:hypothetical protein